MKLRPRWRVRGFTAAEWTPNGGWTKPRRLLRGSVEFADVAYLAGGEVVAVYTRPRAKAPVTVKALVWGSRRGRSEDVVLATYRQGQSVSGLEIRTDARGGAVATWTVQGRPAGTPELSIGTHAAIREPTGRWRPTAVLTGRLGWPALAVAADGSAAVFGQSFDGDLKLTQRGPDGDFGPAVSIAPPARSLEYQVVPVATVVGDTLVGVWQRIDGETAAVQTLAGRIGQPLGPPEPLANFPKGFSFDGMDIASDTAGLVGISWYTGNGGVAQMALRPPGGVFGAPRTLGRADGATPQIAICENGTSYVAFVRYGRHATPLARLYRVAARADRVEGLPSKSWVQELACVDGLPIVLVSNFSSRRGRAVSTIDVFIGG